MSSRTCRYIEKARTEKNEFKNYNIESLNVNGCNPPLFFACFKLLTENESLSNNTTDVYNHFKQKTGFLMFSNFFD